MSSTGTSTPAGGLDASLLKITRNPVPGVLPPSNTLVFGQTPTDHMLTIEWNLETGFEAPEIKPYGPLSLDPSASVLHYSTTMFEGMKVNGLRLHPSEAR
jgi:branched-chain amino acid aminotransferase